VHEYRTRLAWSGSTAVGYDAYARAHDLEIVGPNVSYPLSADPAFRGDPARSNPEQLLLAAAVSCQCLSFLAVAARARLDVVAYRDDATALMPENDPPVRITRIELRPQITLRDGDRPRPDEARLGRLVDIAHRECYIANSLRTDVVIDPRFAWMPEPG